jgi:nicotinamidase-related amidase
MQTQVKEQETVEEFGRFSRADLEETLGYRMGTSPRVGFGEKCGLIVVDMTRDAVKASSFVKKAAEHTVPLLAAARGAKIPIFFTRGGLHYCTNSFAPLTEAERGIYGIKAGPTYVGKYLSEEDFEIATEIAPREGEVLITKYRASAFAGTFLTQLLNWHRLDTLIITGMSTTGCHMSTVRDASSNNYRVIIPEECCAAGGNSGGKGLGANYLSLLGMDRTHGDVLPVAVVVEYLARVAKGQP